MKVTVERVALLKSLGHVHRVVERRNTIPILSNVLLRAEAGRLALRATDLDLEVTETLAADVGQPGAITVPAHVLYDIIRKLPDGSQVSLETTGDVGQVVIRSGRSRFNLQALPETDFPDLAAGDLPTRFMVASGELKRLIEKTQFAISTEETRYYLNGIYLHGHDGGVSSVATNGHVLAWATDRELTLPDDAPGIIIPRKTIGVVAGLFSEGCKIRFSATKIVFSSEDGELVSKLIDGTYPDYRRVVPDDSTMSTRLSFEREDMQLACKRLLGVSHDSRAIKWEIADDSITASVRSEDGSGEEVIPCDGVERSATWDAIGVNGAYVLEVLAALDAEVIDIMASDPGSPIKLRARAATADLLCVVMPLRV